MPEEQMREFKGLVFLDLDGTIEDSRLDMAGSANAVRKNLGLPERDIESMFPFVMKGMDYLYRQCIPEALENPDILPGSKSSDEEIILQKLAEMYHQEYSARIVENTKCYPGMMETLENLAGSFTLGLYTNKPEGLSRLLLEKLGILKHFSLIYGGDTLPESKPSALPLDTGIKAMAQGTTLKPDQIKAKCFMIGDSAGDIQAAATAKVKSIWAAYGYYEEQPDANPDFVAQQPSDIPELISRALKL